MSRSSFLPRFLAPRKRWPCGWNRGRIAWALVDNRFYKPRRTTARRVLDVEADSLRRRAHRHANTQLSAATLVLPFRPRAVRPRLSPFAASLAALLTSSSAWVQVSAGNATGPDEPIELRATPALL